MSIRDPVQNQLEVKSAALKTNKKAETAAAKEDFAWYVYASSTGMKFTSDPGNNELMLTEGTSFGIRPSTISEGMLDLVLEDDLKVIFLLTSDIGATVVERSTEAVDDAESDADSDD